MRRLLALDLDAVYCRDLVHVTRLVMIMFGNNNKVMELYGDGVDADRRKRRDHPSIQR